MILTVFLQHLKNALCFDSPGTWKSDAMIEKVKKVFKEDDELKDIQDDEHVKDVPRRLPMLSNSLPKPPVSKGESK